MRRRLKKPPNVTPDDWDFAAPIVRELHEGTRDRPAIAATSPLASAWRTELRRAESKGNVAAGRVVDAAADVGLMAFAKLALKDESGSIALAYNGGPPEVTTMPMRYGVHPRDPVTGERLQQGEIWRWVELTYEDAIHLGQQLIAQGDTLIARGTGIVSTANALRKKYPDTRTPLEAMERAGIDPQAFEWNIDVG